MCSPAFAMAAPSAKRASASFPTASAISNPRSRCTGSLPTIPAPSARGLEIAERCQFQLDALRYEYPDELVPPGQSPIEYLARADLSRRGRALPRRHSPESAGPARSRAEADRAAQFRGLFSDRLRPGPFRPLAGDSLPGRGSAANSAVCYCLGVTSVDPGRIDLLFERFISAARNEPPGHRHRFRARAPRGGDPIRLREIWPRPRRA